MTSEYFEDPQYVTHTGIVEPGGYVKPHEDEYPEDNFSTPEQEFETEISDDWLVRAAQEDDAYWRRIHGMTTEEQKRLRRSNDGLILALGGAIDEPADIEWVSPEKGRKESPFDISLSGRLSTHEVSRVEDFLENHITDLTHFLGTVDESQNTDESEEKIKLNFVDNEGMAIAAWRVVKPELSKGKVKSLKGSEKDLMKDIARGYKGLYSPEDKVITINVEQKKHLDDDVVLFNTVTHELTHYKDDLEGKELKHPKLMKTAKNIGKTAMVGLGMHVAYKTNIGPEVGPVNLVDPILVYAGWKMRGVGAVLGLLAGYGVKPSEVRARKEAKRAVKQYIDQ